MGEFESLTVTSLAISKSDGVGITQAERNRVRSSVKEIEVLAHMDAPWHDIEKKYQRAMGRIGRLISCNHPEGKRLKARLNTVKAFYGDTALSHLRETFVSGAGAVTDMASDVPPWME
ncbi:hypothetical protein D9M71_602170 [compost metagenome]